jgi:hypothetical protein
VSKEDLKKKKKKDAYVTCSKPLLVQEKNSSKSTCRNGRKVRRRRERVMAWKQEDTFNTR